MATALDITKYIQCSFCRNLFEDPVPKGCEHSFCQHCLDQHMSMNDQQCPLCDKAVYTKPRVNAANETRLRELPKSQKPKLDLYTGKRGEIPCSVCDEDQTSRAVKSCLTCLHSYCERHLKRHQSLERYRHHKLLNPVEKLEERACREHGRPLELYCRQEKRLVCVLCVTTGEDVIPVEKERERREAKQQQNIEKLESMIHRSEKKLEDLQKTVTKYEIQIDREKNEIQEVFAEMMKIVRRAAKDLLAPLEDGRRHLEVERAEKTQQIQKDILKYRETIGRLNKNQKEEDDIIFLQSYPSVPAEFTNDWTVSIDTDLRFGSMRKLISTTLGSIRTKLENLCSLDITRIQKFAVDVTMDEETAHPSLEVSEDGKSVKYKGDNYNFPCSPQQFNLVGGILGKFPIKSGRAFWVVEVGQKTSWELGVVRKNANRKGKVSYKPNEGYWAIALCSSNLYGAFEDPPINLYLSTKPQRVGVFVDYEEAFVSFYDMDNQSHIYTFTECSFNETLHPYFNTHPNKDGNNDGHPMTICSVNPVDI